MGFHQASLVLSTRTSSLAEYVLDILVTGQNALDQADSERELDTRWQRAIDRREFPDTVLAHGIFTNMQKYPDDIILTRVGMFYEVCVPGHYA